MLPFSFLGDEAGGVMRKEKEEKKCPLKEGRHGANPCRGRSAKEVKKRKFLVKVFYRR